VSDDVACAILNAARIFEEMGARIVDVALPDKDALLAAYYVISSAEASSNLSRFDGVRYGKRAKNTRSVDELITKSRSEGFGDEVKRRIMLGTYALSRDGRDAYYKRALGVRKQLLAHLENTFCECDCILMPVSPTVAYRFADKKSTPLEVYREDSLCVLANMSGLPAISLPCGVGEGKMPVGMQLMGAAHSEPLLYRIASAFSDIFADEVSL
jgi:aspartyl-tRNA(Asn)/glutamyl-tRNA(Gln) amidotransferase subunit A